MERGIVNRAPKGPQKDAMCDFRQQNNQLEQMGTTMVTVTRHHGNTARGGPWEGVDFQRLQWLQTQRGHRKVGRYLADAQNRRNVKMPLRHLWVRDFNRHHPLWDEEKNTYLFTKNALEATQPLVDLLNQYDMDTALPKDTHRLIASSTKNHSGVDNLFCSAMLIDRFIGCDTQPGQRPISVPTPLELKVEEGEVRKRREWKGTAQGERSESWQEERTT